MPYSTKTDIESVYGVTNVAVWSQLNESASRAATGIPAADSARINAAIAYADAVIDDRFRGGRYAVPLSPVSPIVTNWSAVLAGIWLYRSRGVASGADTADANRYVGMEQNVYREMDLYLGGARTLTAAQADTFPTMPVGVR